MIERELLTFPLEGKDVEAEMKTFNDEIACLYGAESPEIVEGRKRNRGQLD